MKKINFKVLSRKEAEADWVQEKITEPHILISIYGTTGGDSTPAEIPDNENRVELLKVCFDDLSDRHREILDNREEKNNYIFFSEDHARNILNFVEKNIDKVDLIVVHCFAGVCRSVACAAALSKILNNEDDRIFKSGVPNMLVYSTILEKFWLSDYGTLWPKINELNFENIDHYK